MYAVPTALAQPGLPVQSNLTTSTHVPLSLEVTQRHCSWTATNNVTHQAKDTFRLWQMVL